MTQPHDPAGTAPLADFRRAPSARRWRQRVAPRPLAAACWPRFLIFAAAAPPRPPTVRGSRIDQPVGLPLPRADVAGRLLRLAKAAGLDRIS